MASNLNYNGLEEVKLIATIVNDEYEKVESLLQAGVNVNEKSALGATPLHWAACVGNLDCISTLMDLGADIRATTSRRETALHFAARCGQAEVVLLLLDWGADIQATDLRERTVLHSAVENGEDNCKGY
jgi:ankyrin repeat protein